MRKQIHLVMRANDIVAAFLEVQSAIDKCDSHNEYYLVSHDIEDFYDVVTEYKIRILENA